MITSYGQLGVIYSYNSRDINDIETESLDISGAFLQGLEYLELAKAARRLGYEYKVERCVYISPPENVWRHFREMDIPASFKLPDHLRSWYVLKCKKAMYGFNDAPLMFQLALLSFLIEETAAYVSVFDENFLYWLDEVPNQYGKLEWQLVLCMTVHVDDLQVTGSKTMRSWIYQELVKRFGTIKRQVYPYTHTGLQIEKISTDAILVHQEHFCSKLEQFKIPPELLSNPDKLLEHKDITTFRSLTCSALWACQTRLEELSCVTSLQTKLQSPQVSDLIEINACIKRLKRTQSRMGVWFRRMTPPYRVVVVTDASSANKKSSFATEGAVIGLMEDRIVAKPTMLKDDYMTTDDVALLGGLFHTLVATSQKSKRVSHSTSHAETLSAAKSIPVGQLISLRLSEPDFVISHERVLTPLLLMELQDSGKAVVPVDVMIDCMDLWELATGLRGIPQDKSQRLGVLSIREERRTLRLRRFMHLRTHWMLADLLTKHSGYVSKSLHELLSSGHWSVESDIRMRQHFGIGESEEYDKESYLCTLE